jgi:8-oxo-dGTP pyrophosphatase MutT (NUDIX family)
MTKYAACVLIVDDEDNILSLLRSDGKGYGLPGGKLDPGESLDCCAVRECFEETGHVCVLEGVPFVALCGEHTVYTYFAKTVAVGQPTHAHEGEAMWVKPIKLIEETAFKQYDTDCFDFFGISF